jgi:HK97 family phage portal protein
MRWNSWGTVGEQSIDSAMTLSAVFACLRLLSEAISTLPLDTYIRTDGARRPFRPRPAYLDFQPPQGSRITYLSQVMLSLLTDGNAFVYTPRDEFGVPVTLAVLDPTLVSVHRKGADHVYVVEVPGKRSVELDSFEVMHIAGMTLPGCNRGVSPLRAAREVITSGRKAQEFGSSFFENSAVPPAVIEMPDDADRDRATKIAQTWNETHGGTSNAGKVGVLMGGATLKTVAISPEDAEWLDSKRFSVSEVARFYGVPPHLIADASNSTSWGSGLAEQNLAFGQFSLRPWTERIEDGHGRLLTTHGLPQAFVKLNLDALLRASLSDRYESYAVGIENGFLTVNEARRLEDLQPVPWGNEPAVPAPGGAA